MRSNFLSLRLTILLAVLSVTFPHALAGAYELPDGKGKEVVKRMCGTQCHGVDKVTVERLSRQGWSNVVDTMISRGATGTDEEIELVIDYLAEHFGRGKGELHSRVKNSRDQS